MNTEKAITKISKGAVSIQKHRVTVGWTEDGKRKTKHFTYTKKRSKEQAEQQAKEYYEREVLPRYQSQVAERVSLRKQKRQGWVDKKKEETYTCDCGMTLKHFSRWVHERSVNHRIKLDLVKKEDLPNWVVKVRYGKRGRPPVIPRELNDGSMVSTNDPDCWKDRCEGCAKKEFNCRCGSAGYN